LKDRLEYIAALGYSAVWISPVFQNMENSYHGYAQIDFTLLDDRFGTLQEFREMVRLIDLYFRVMPGPRGASSGVARDLRYCR
jgi:glycosidase